jgi:hypothetical protein
MVISDKFYDSLKRDESIVNFDFQGWPNRKMDLKTILEAIGFGTYEVNGEQFLGIRSDSKILTVYPSILNDDGMGYGVNEQFIVDVTSGGENNDETHCHFFTETEMKNKEMWFDNHILPGGKIKFMGHNVKLWQAHNINGDRWFVGRIYDEGLIPSSINVPESYVKNYVKENLEKDE